MMFTFLHLLKLFLQIQNPEVGISLGGEVLLPFGDWSSYFNYWEICRFFIWFSTGFEWVKLQRLVESLDVTTDFNWRYSRNCVFLMPNFWIRCWNLMTVLFWVMHMKCSGLLVTEKSGMFQIDEHRDGAPVELVTWIVFHQAVRVEAMVIFWKYWCRLMKWLTNGRSASNMSGPVLFHTSEDHVLVGWSI